jgi:hypothetical protein
MTYIRVSFRSPACTLHLSYLLARLILVTVRACTACCMPRLDVNTRPVHALVPMNTMLSQTVTQLRSAPIVGRLNVGTVKLLAQTLAECG